MSEVLKLSQDDKSTIVSLKKEIEKLWNMLETSHEKEQRGRQTIQSLKVCVGYSVPLVPQLTPVLGGDSESDNFSGEGGRS